MNQDEIHRLVQQGIAAAQAGDKDRARRILLEVTEYDEYNEQAWLWLSGVVEDLEEMQLCLENVLMINPSNEQARQGLDWVQSQLAQQQPPPAPSIEEQLTEAVPLPAAPPVEEPEAPETRVPCPACGAMNFDFATECVKCNFPFAVVCPSCNDLVPTDTGLCPNCGTELPLPQKLAGVQEREAQVEGAFRDGLAQLEAGHYQEAKASFEQVLAADPDHIEALYNLGEACANLGLTQEARQYWEEVQAIQPSHPYIQQALESLLSPRERRQLARQRRKEEQERRRREQVEGRPPGQTILAEYERKLSEKPPPEELMGGFEAFLYALMVGFVIGVAYALNVGSEPTIERVPTILKQSLTIAVVIVFFWIALGVGARLLSLIFKASGSVNGFMVSASRFLLPFLLLFLPILISIPQIVAFLPEQAVIFLQRFRSAPWFLFVGIALLWGLFLLTRGVARVGRIALWKGLLVGLAALIVASAVAAGVGYGGHTLADRLDYLDMLGFGPETPTPSPTPSLAPTPTPEVTPAPTPGG